jgi:hypothetical protein
MAPSAQRQRRRQGLRHCETLALVLCSAPKIAKNPNYVAKLGPEMRQSQCHRTWSHASPANQGRFKDLGLNEWQSNRRHGEI